MKYTREQLEKMGEVELSIALVEKLGYYHQPLRSYVIGEFPSIVCEKDGKWFSFVLDQWDCIMPLAVEHKISLDPVDDGTTWLAGASTYFRFLDKSPQRAIACCLLMMELNK